MPEEERSGGQVICSMHSTSESVYREEPESTHARGFVAVSIVLGDEKTRAIGDHL